MIFSSKAEVEEKLLANLVKFLVGVMEVLLLQVTLLSLESLVGGHPSRAVEADCPALVILIEVVGGSVIH